MQSQNSQSLSLPDRPKAKGNYTGERLKVLRPETYRRVVRLLAEPRQYVSYREICRQCHVTDDTVKAIEQREAIPIATRKQALMEQAARIAKLATDRVEDQIDTATLPQAVVTMGVMTDKVLALSADHSGIKGFEEWAIVISSGLSGLLIVIGVVRLRHHRVSAYRWFERGVLVQLFRGPYALLLDGFSFLWSAFFLGRIDAEEPPGVPNDTGGLLSGVRWIRHNAVIRAELLGVATLNLFNFMFFALFLLYVTRELHVRPAPRLANDPPAIDVSLALTKALLIAVPRVGNAPIDADISDLTITTDGKLAFARYVFHMTGTNKALSRRFTALFGPIRPVKPPPLLRSQEGR